MHLIVDSLRNSKIASTFRRPSGFWVIDQNNNLTVWSVTSKPLGLPKFQWHFRVPWTMCFKMHMLFFKKVLTEHKIMLIFDYRCSTPVMWLTANTTTKPTWCTLALISNSNFNALFTRCPFHLAFIGMCVTIATADWYIVTGTVKLAFCHTKQMSLTWKDSTVPPTGFNYTFFHYTYYTECITTRYVIQIVQGSEHVVIFIHFNTSLVQKYLF